MELAFPGITSDRTTYIHGIRPLHSLHTIPLPDPRAVPRSDLDRSTLFPSQKSLVGELQSLMSENDVLKAENEMLKSKNLQLQQRVAELQGKVTSLQQSSLSHTAASLEQQATGLVSSSCLMYGPDTIQHLNSFSLKGILIDVVRQAPDLLQLFRVLSRSSRNVHNDSLSVEEIKSLVSLCILLNARTNRASGIQLLISIMLIARSTSKQVWEVYCLFSVTASTFPCRQ